MDRDRTKQLVEHTNKINRQKKELELSKNLRQEVEIGATGTQRYRIKKGLIKENTIMGVLRGGRRIGNFDIRVGLPRDKSLVDIAKDPVTKTTLVVLELFKDFCHK